MWAIFKKEVFGFFNSATGYLVILLFLLLNGLFLWVFKGGFNVFDYGFADLSHFFMLLPWVFLILIPAITMRSFSEERKSGTLELILIKPISSIDLVLGKFFGTLMIGLMAMIPTLLYIWAIYDLGIVSGNFDLGVIIGSYMGGILLMAVYASIGLFTSALTENQVFAFISALGLCFVIFYGPNALATLYGSGTLQQTIQAWGGKYHLEGISKGILASENVLYFLSVMAFFVFLTIKRLQRT